MQAYVVRRLLALIPTLFFASLIVFVTVRLIPGNVIDLMLSQNDISAGNRSRVALEAALGLDRPLLVQYGRWIGAILSSGDLGKSLWQNIPVTGLILQRLPVTFELGLLSLVVALSLAIPIGVYSAVRQDTAGDYVMRSFSILMLAVPSFWLGTLVVVFPSIWWGWSPEIGYVPFTRDPIQNLSQMIMPAIILGTGTVYITLSALSWDPADFNWKSNHDTGATYEQLFAADLSKSARNGGKYDFVLDAYIPPEAIRGELAEGWEWKQNPLRVEIKLRRGVMFPDKPGVMKSRELVADDVVNSYNG